MNNKNRSALQEGDDDRFLLLSDGGSILVRIEKYSIRRFCHL